MGKVVRFSQSARKHRVGRLHALFVINLYEPLIDADDPDRKMWVGADSRGRELEIIGIELEEYLLVIHVMPTRRVKGYGKEK